MLTQKCRPKVFKEVAGHKNVVEPLVEALNDENSQVCITATDALIEIGDVATDALIDSLDHEKVNVRCDATLLRAIEGRIEL